MIRNEFNIFLVDRGINWKIRRPPGKLLRQWATRIYAFFRPIFLLILRSNENILDSFLKSSAYVNRNILITYTFEIDASRLYLVPYPQIKRWALITTLCTLQVMYTLVTCTVKRWESVIYLHTSNYTHWEMRVLVYRKEYSLPF